jgi:hypothetical protein
MQALLRNHLVPQLLKPKIRVGVGLERAARPGTNPYTSVRIGHGRPSRGQAVS